MSVDTMEVPESDKPFYLAILSGIIIGIVIVMGFVGSYTGKPEAVTFAKEIATPVFALVGMAWAFYFGKKT